MRVLPGAARPDIAPFRILGELDEGVGGDALGGAGEREDMVFGDGLGEWRCGREGRRCCEEEG